MNRMTAEEMDLMIERVKNAMRLMDMYLMDFLSERIDVRLFLLFATSFRQNLIEAMGPDVQYRAEVMDLLAVYGKGSRYRYRVRPDSLDEFLRKTPKKRFFLQVPTPCGRKSYLVTHSVEDPDQKELIFDSFFDLFLEWKGGFLWLYSLQVWLDARTLRNLKILCHFRPLHNWKQRWNAWQSKKKYRRAAWDNAEDD